MAVNLVLHRLHEALLMMAVKRSSLGGSADGNYRYQGNGGSEKQVFHVSLVSIGVDAACLRQTLMRYRDLTENE